MASKRIFQSSINWAEIAKRIPDTEKKAYLAFKDKSEGYIRKMMALPDEPPKIDWESYKSKITVAGLVEDFEKTYADFEIPYPEDKYSSVINEYENDIAKGIEEFKAESDAIIKKSEARIDEINNMLPFSQMTYEDAAYIEPELVLDLENKPSFWPHSEFDFVFDDKSEEETLKTEKKKKCVPAH